METDKETNEQKIEVQGEQKQKEETEGTQNEKKDEIKETHGEVFSVKDFQNGIHIEINSCLFNAQQLQCLGLDSYAWVLQNRNIKTGEYKPEEKSYH